MELDVHTLNVTVLVETVGSLVYALDYDYKNRYVYFPRYSKQDIVRYVKVYSDDIDNEGNFELNVKIKYKAKQNYDFNKFNNAY